MLARKQRALADLAAAQTLAAATPRDAADRMARRLQGLAIENKRLLERAIAAQGRVIGVIAQAAAAQAATGGYGPSQGPAGRSRLFGEGLTRRPVRRIARGAAGSAAG